MTRIDREKKVVRLMIGIWCRKHHDSSSALCPECQALFEYAQNRLSHCRYGDSKPTCRKCPVHCYKPQMRDKIRDVMRFSGPRMILYHPVAAIRHLLQEIR